MFIARDGPNVQRRGNIPPAVAMATECQTRAGGNCSFDSLYLRSRLGDRLSAPDKTVTSTGSRSWLVRLRRNRGLTVRTPSCYTGTAFRRMRVPSPTQFPVTARLRVG